MAIVTEQPDLLTSPYHRLRDEGQASTEELESLMTNNEVLVVYTRSAVGNKYRVLNLLHQELYCANEERKDPWWWFCAPIEGCEREFSFQVNDIKGHELMGVNHPYELCGQCVCCADGCAQCPFYILNNRGEDMGMIRPLNYCCHPVFGIFDTKDTLLYQIRSSQLPTQNSCCPADINFPVLRASDDVEVGRITKTRSEISNGFYNAYNLQMGHVQDTKHRALLLVATFAVHHFLYLNDGKY